MVTAEIEQLFLGIETDNIICLSAAQCLGDDRTFSRATTHPSNPPCAIMLKFSVEQESELERSSFHFCQFSVQNIKVWVLIRGASSRLF